MTWWASKSKANIDRLQHKVFDVILGDILEFEDLKFLFQFRINRSKIKKLIFITLLTDFTIGHKKLNLWCEI